MELISVVITTHNRDKELKRAIQSVLNQTYKHIELIVIDDNSTASTQRVVSEFKNVIKYHISHSNGLCSSRNKGIELSNGEFIVFLDDDDVLKKDSIEKRRNLFLGLDDKVKSQTAIIYSGCSILLKKEKRITFNSPNIKGCMFKSLSNGVIKTIPSTFFLNKKVLVENEIKFDETFTSFVDHDFFLQLARKKLHMYAVNEPLTETYIFSSKDSMVNDIDKRLINLNRLLYKWASLFQLAMNNKKRKQFLSIYISKEYSNLLFTSIVRKNSTYLTRVLIEMSQVKEVKLSVFFRTFKILVFRIFRAFVPGPVMKFLR